jgi:hypothetical protein
VAWDENAGDRERRRRHSTAGEMKGVSGGALNPSPSPIGGAQRRRTAHPCA